MTKASPAAALLNTLSDLDPCRDHVDWDGTITELTTRLRNTVNNSEAFTALIAATVVIQGFLLEVACRSHPRAPATRYWPN